MAMLIDKLDCEEIMTALDECHAKGFIHKAIGSCNDIKRDVNKCLSAERYDRAKRNREEARSNRRRVEELWAKERELDQGSSNTAATAAATAAASTGAAKQ
jgi:COX assembly protein 2